MKQEGMQNTDWKNSGTPIQNPTVYSRSNSQVPEYPLLCDTEILSCDDDYPQVVARMPKLNTGWLTKARAGSTIPVLSRIFKTKRLVAISFAAILVSGGIFGTILYLNTQQKEVVSVSTDQVSNDSYGSHALESHSISTNQAGLGTKTQFVSPVISSETEKGILARSPAENQVPDPWAQTGVATSSLPAATTTAVPMVSPAISDKPILPVSVPQAPAQVSSSTQQGVPSYQAANPGWSDLTLNTGDNRPSTQYTAEKPAETPGVPNAYPGNHHAANTAPSGPNDIRLVSGQNNSTPNDAFSTRIIDENGQNVASTSMGLPAGMPMAANQSFNPDTGSSMNTSWNSNPYAQSVPNEAGTFSVPMDQVPAGQPVQEPVRVASNPYASNQPFVPQPPIPAYTTGPSVAVESAPITTNGVNSGSVIASPMGQFTSLDSPAPQSGTAFVPVENGFRGYSIDTEKQNTPTRYSSNPYLEKTDRIR